MRCVALQNQPQRGVQSNVMPPLHHPTTIINIIRHSIVTDHSALQHKFQYAQQQSYAASNSVHLKLSTYCLLPACPPDFALLLKDLECTQQHLPMQALQLCTSRPQAVHGQRAFNQHCRLFVYYKRAVGAPHICNGEAKTHQLVACRAFVLLRSTLIHHNHLSRAHRPLS